ncbi:tryptophan dimethylallyltransferase family protein [Actinacidiphila sp. bgisy145]|uniref:tryptophan dimethylallyltransferase family protein n=1 Tax=Actinacidiphila sp. bgisy145 TaxID=3413792 RepID=UPI003EC00819
MGGLVTDQLARLCDIAQLDRTDTETYVQVLAASLGPAATRSLALPPPAPTLLSDDHTPVEYSLAFLPGATPALRVLVEPGCESGDLAENGRTGLRAIRAMAERWDFSTAQLDLLEDLFLPDHPAGPFALWCALELRPGGVPGVKVYLNPAANGPDRRAATLREALRRLGHHQAFDALPPADDHPFLALDLGEWAAPRVKVYCTHDRLTAEQAGRYSRLAPAEGRDQAAEFFDAIAGVEEHGSPTRRALTCYSFTDTATGRPSGFTLHMPVRAYVGHDGAARDRTVRMLERYGMDAGALDRALAAVTSRRLADGVGLVAYVALVHQDGRAPRITVYVSAEAYRVQPPRPAAAASPHPLATP